MFFLIMGLLPVRSSELGFKILYVTEIRFFVPGRLNISHPCTSDKGHALSESLPQHCGRALHALPILSLCVLQFHLVHYHPIGGTKFGKQNLEFRDEVPISPSSPLYANRTPLHPAVRKVYFRLRHVTLSTALNTRVVL